MPAQAETQAANAGAAISAKSAPAAGAAQQAGQAAANGQFFVGGYITGTVVIHDTATGTGTLTLATLTAVTHTVVTLTKHSMLQFRDESDFKLNFILLIL